MGQLYAALYDVMTRDGEAQPQRVTTTIRTAWSFGFVFGPLLGSALATVVGIRAAFLVAAALYLLCLVPLQRLTIAVPAQHDRGAEDSAPSTSRAPRLLLAFTALCALVLCGQTFRNAYLPLHITTHLGGSMAAVSTLMAISPVVELVTLPLAGALADRVGLSWLIGTGLAIATVEYVIVAASTAVWQLYLTQALDACVVAVVLGLGLTYAQRLSPQRPGLASSLLFSAFNLSGIVGGLLGSVAVPLLGVPRLFLVPAGLCAICAIAFVGIERVGQAGPKERHRGAVATAAPLREATRR